MAAMVMAVSCSKRGDFSSNDLSIIHGTPGELLKIYTVESEEDLVILRNISEDLSLRALEGDDYALLVERMKKTVADTTVGGVGIILNNYSFKKQHNQLNEQLTQLENT